MAKQKAFLIVGLPHTGVPHLVSALEAHRDTLAAAGIGLPAKSAEEMLRVAVEVRREHRAWGLRRKDVEGAWSKVCRRAFKDLGSTPTVVVGHELLAGASTEEIALVADGLAGTKLHVIVLAAEPDARLGLFPDELDLAEVVERWSHAVATPGRLHVVVADPAQPEAAWASLGLLVGFDATALPLPDPAGTTPPADTATLRLVAEASAVQVGHDERVEAAERWAKVVADQGYDVLGDLRDLVPQRRSGSTDPARAAYDDRVEVLSGALVEAVTEVGRLRERVRELEHQQRKGAKRLVRLPGVLVRGA